MKRLWWAPLALAWIQLAVCAQAPKLVYATYAGTGPNSEFRALAADSSGFAYVAGQSPGEDTGKCTFVEKLNQSGTGVVWTTCLPLLDISALALDNSGYIYVTGPSPDYNSSRSSLVIKLTPDAQDVIYATPLAGAVPGSIAIDGSGAVYVAGSVMGAQFQTTPGAYSGSSAMNTFAAKLDPSGTVQYAARLDLRASRGIAVDSVGRAWIVGTSCRNPDCAGLALAVRELDENGAQLLFSMSRGGSGPGGLRPTFSDSAGGVAVDANDAVWIAGVDETGSIPTTPDAIRTVRPSDNFFMVPFALKLAPTGEILYATYLDGYASQAISNLALDGFGNPYFSFMYSELSSVLVALAADGSKLLFSQPFAGWVGTTALDGNGGLYLAGGPQGPAFSTSSCPTTAGAYQTSAVRGENFVCVARFDLYQSAQAEVFYPLNGASMAGAIALAPGEAFTVNGLNLPANASVTIGGLSAPVVAATASQISAVVPFGIKPGWTLLQVDGVGIYTLGVWPSEPGLYTAGGTGSGQLDARNADGTVNSVDNPAAAGSMVTLFMTGAGLMDPAIADGVVGPSDPPHPTPTQPVYAAINGTPANVVSVFQSPGKIAGIVQVKIQNPAEVNDKPVQVAVGKAQLLIPFNRRLRVHIGSDFSS